MKVAVFGCGMIAQEHLRAIQKCPQATIVGITDPNKDALKETAKTFGIPATFEDAQTLLEETKPDVVHVATPPAIHYDLVKLALDAGAHVYVEKPFTLRAPEAEELVRLAEARNLKICVGYMHLFDDAMIRARKMVEDGEIGSICGLESYYGFDLGTTPGGRYMTQAYTHWAYKLPGGLFQNGLDHPLSTVLPFMSEPSTVLAAAGEAGVLPKGIPSELRIILGDGKCLASVTLSEAASPRFHYLNILGSTGTLQVDLQNKRVVKYGHKKGIPHFVTRAFMNVNQGFRVLAGTLGTVLTVLRGRFTPYEGMQRLVPEFYRSIENDEPCPIPASWSLSVMRMMDSVWEQIGSENTEVKGGAVVPISALASSDRMSSGESVAKKKVLVTGGTGFIGSRLAKALLRDGSYSVRVMARNLDKAKELEALGAEIVVGNMFDERSVRAAVEGVNIVYHLAATMGGKKADYLEGTVKGTQKLMRAAAENGVERVILASSIAVYGIPNLPNGQSVTEDTPYASENLTPYIESKADAERVMIAEAEQSGIAVSILRLGVVYGPGKGISRIGYPVGGSFFVKVGISNITLPSVFVDNAVQALTLAGESEAQGSHVYNVVDDACFTQLGYLKKRREFTPTSWTYLPYTLLSAMGAITRALPTGIMRRIAMYLTPFHLMSCVREIAYSTSKIKDELGWAPESNLDAHLAKTFGGDAGDSVEEPEETREPIEPVRRSA